MQELFKAELEEFSEIFLNHEILFLFDLILNDDNPDGIYSTRQEGVWKNSSSIHCTEQIFQRYSIHKSEEIVFPFNLSDTMFSKVIQILFGPEFSNETVSEILEDLILEIYTTDSRFLRDSGKPEYTLYVPSFYVDQKHIAYDLGFIPGIKEIKLISPYLTSGTITIGLNTHYRREES